MGPWAFAGVFLKFMLPKNRKMIMISSYFTSTRHEMKGALDAIRIRDYGLLPKIRYFLVYEIVARIFHIFERLTLNFCDIVVIHYESSRAIIKRHFNTAMHKIHMFPWYNEVFKRENNNTLQSSVRIRHPLIVSICRQDPRKGINFIIRAIGIVAKEIPNINCLIVGSGSFLSLNKKLVEKLSLEKHIQIVGFVPDINPILKEADVAVIVPLAQGSSALTVLEAMSYGKAIIGSNCDGIPEDIVHNKTGLIVKKGNEYELADAIIRLIKNNQLRGELGNNAKKASERKFGFDKMKNDIAILINKYTLK